jgi:hypothetical protein
MAKIAISETSNIIVFPRDSKGSSVEGSDDVAEARVEKAASISLLPHPEDSRMNFTRSGLIPLKGNPV